VENAATGSEIERGFTLSTGQHSPSKLGAGLLDLPRGAKRLLAVLTDSALCVLTSLSGYQWLAVTLSILLAIPLLSAFGFYQTVIRYAGKQTIVAALRAVGLYALIFSAVFTVYGFPLVPRTIGVLQPLLLLIGLALVRILASQLLSEQIANTKQLASSPAVLIYGAGNSGRQLAASIRMSGQSRVVGFLDDNVGLHHAKIEDVVVHPPSQLEKLIAQHAVQTVLLAMPSLPQARRSEIIRALSNHRVAVRTLPALSDLASGKVGESDLREIKIEDLLGREPVPPRQELLEKKITGKVVLVTGAGGSIGSELCRQICKLRPRHLILLEVSEFALYAINEELSAPSNLNGFKITPVLASVLDRELIEDIFKAHRPHTIYHTAAYKHVPLVESNPFVGLQNNVVGTLNVAEAALSAKAGDMVLISTDKAVRPTNVMGASKRLAEMIVQAIAQRKQAADSLTHFCIVRFGNVLGSSGSVVPKFREQISAGGPITITHPEVTRYFMTIPEAAQLVIQAAGLSASFRNEAPIYLLDMGDSVRILDLAKTMVQLSGLQVRDSTNPEGDIDISFVGLRPGEKLYEELLIAGEPLPTTHPKIKVTLDQTISHNPGSIEAIISLCQNKLSTDELKTALVRLNTGYTPSA
jgi:FlaA1/EpsC-like NDP-sugar epimerase